jgi:glycosyltransferase involved in cell wall biosynthesis
MHTDTALVSRVARMYSLVRKALEVFIFEGPKALVWRQQLWIRKHYYYMVGHRRAQRLLERGAVQPSIPLTIGASAPDQRANSSLEAQFKVLFVVPIENPYSMRYRVDNVRTQLGLWGVASDTLFNVDVARRLDHALSFDIVVFHRLPVTPELTAFASLARSRGIALVFDVDDYIFEPSMIPHIPALNDATLAQKTQIVEECTGCSGMLRLCDFFIGSTHFLAARAHDLGHRAFVIRNGLNERQIAIAQRAVAKRSTSKRQTAQISLGYLSGTKTHHRDFATALPAILRILAEFPQVVLVIRGLFDIPMELHPYAHRIQRQPYVSWERLVTATAELDVVIAPLDLNNSFTEGKSALKYFEAGLVSVPVVASPTLEFQYSIRHGDNGFLAYSSDAWYDAMYKLIVDSELRAAVGSNARSDVLARYTPDAQSLSTLQVFQSILDNEPNTTRLSG